MGESEHNAAYKRVLLKLSGEALMGSEPFGIDPSVLDRMASDIKAIVELGIEVGVVVGGGNLFRGASLHEAGMDRVVGDHMGMLATVMNGLAMRDAMTRAGIRARLMSAIQMTGVTEVYDRLEARHALSQGEVVIFAAGTGNPFFTTDSAASLRAIEIKADLLLKATKVDGIYNADPFKDKTAVKYDELTYDEVLDKKLGVMDLTAICLCRDHAMPVRVFDMLADGVLFELMKGGSLGTLIKVD